jgi:hypothetical protein
MLLAGGMDWCTGIYLGVKYDTWVCLSGFRIHQTFLEIVTQFEPTVSIDAYFLLQRLGQICSVARFTFNFMLNFLLAYMSLLTIKHQCVLTVWFHIAWVCSEVQFIKLVLLRVRPGCYVRGIIIWHLSNHVNSYVKLTFNIVRDKIWLTSFGCIWLEGPKIHLQSLWCLNFGKWQFTPWSCYSHNTVNSRFVKMWIADFIVPFTWLVPATFHSQKCWWKQEKCLFSHCL